jgi:hypothetical protein
MPDWTYFLAIAMVAAVSPYLWILVLTVLLWICYRLLPDQAGRVLFGHYWKKGRGNWRLKKPHPSHSDGALERRRK